MPTDPDEIPAPGSHPAVGTGKGYHLGAKWKGFPMYQCDTCHFNTLDEHVMRDHVENAKENNERLAAEAKANS